MSTLNTKFFCSNLNSLNTFIKEMGSPNVVVKLSKVGSNAIVPAPHKGQGPEVVSSTLRYHIPSFMVQWWVGAHPFAQLHKICAICSRLKKERLSLTI
jgi:hypothetical protein